MFQLICYKLLIKNIPLYTNNLHLHGMLLYFAHLGVKKPCGIGRVYNLVLIFVLFCFEKQLKLRN